MKKCLLFLALCLGLLLGAVPWQQVQAKSSLDDVLELSGRSFQPGSILKVVVRENRPIRQAVLRFQGRKYFPAWIEDRALMMSLIGIDIHQEPGTFSVTLSLYFEDGRHEELSQDIVIQPRDFPVKKLWVKEEYVTPPQEVQERISREAELVRAVYEIYTPQWLGDGRFHVPCEGDVIPNFGERRIYNNKPRSSHSGVDITSPLGSPVLASNAGRVVLAADLYFAGKTVIIDHGLGVFSLYCHFAKIRTERGNFVEKGEIIGEVGATGRVTGPHLHWAVSIVGSRVDPFSLLQIELD